jgi:hypothetical protein
MRPCRCGSFGRSVAAAWCDESIIPPVPPVTPPPPGGRRCHSPRCTSCPPVRTVERLPRGGPRAPVGALSAGPHTPVFASLRLPVRQPLQRGGLRSSHPRRALLVKPWRHRQAVMLCLVIIDPERGLFLREDPGGALHRRLSLLLVDVVGGDPAMVPICLEMHHIAGQHQCTGLRQLDQRRLMAGRVSRRGEDRHVSILSARDTAAHSRHHAGLGDPQDPAPSETLCRPTPHRACPCPPNTV